MPMWIVECRPGDKCITAEFAGGRVELSVWTGGISNRGGQFPPMTKFTDFYYRDQHKKINKILFYLN